MDEDTIQYDYAKDFVDSFENTGGEGQGDADGAKHSSFNSTDVLSGTKKKAMYFMEAMYSDHKDGVERDAIIRNLKNLGRNKDAETELGTTDIGPLLVTSNSKRMNDIRKANTVILNMCEAAPGEELYCDGYVYKQVTRRIGTQQASRINMEADDVADNPKSLVYSEDLQTLMFWGDPVVVPFVVSAQLQNQGQSNVAGLRAQIDGELFRIREAMSYDFWFSLEQSSYAVGNIPALRGIIEDIITNTEAVGGLELAEENVEDMKAQIALYFGHVQMALIVDEATVGTVRVIEQDRLDGENSMSFAQHNEELARQFARYKVNAVRIFQPNIPPAIPVIAEPLFNGTGNAVLMSIEDEHRPRIAYFRINGQKGPWTWVRQIRALKETVMVAQGATLDLGPQQSRSLASGVTP